MGVDTKNNNLVTDTYHCTYHCTYNGQPGNAIVETAELILKLVIIVKL